MKPKSCKLCEPDMFPGETFFARGAWWCSKCDGLTRDDLAARR